MHINVVQVQDSPAQRGLVLTGTGGGPGDDDSPAGAARISVRFGGGGGGAFLRCACASTVGLDGDAVADVGGRGMRLLASAENLRSSTKVLMRDVTPPSFCLPKSILSA